MKKNYTISSLKEVKNLPNLDTVQFTINSRIFPSKRNTVQFIKDSKVTNDILVHWDYIYIISRYSMFTKSLQNAILDECHSILEFASHNSNVKGVIMHTDYPINKEVLSGKKTVEESYNSGLWNKDNVKYLLDSKSLILKESVKAFYNDYLNKFNSLPKVKIYLENSTKINKETKEASLNFIISLLEEQPELKELFGICIDTEHYFAVEGEYPSLDEILDLNIKFDIVVHLNTIPKEVTGGSFKDRHSETTLTECSVNSVEFYNNYINVLEENNILYIREVKENTMYREIEQLWK